MSIHTHVHDLIKMTPNHKNIFVLKHKNIQHIKSSKNDVCLQTV